MGLPSFVVIGAMRCGTTSMHAYLREHPEIFMSPEKEPDYFSLGDLPPSELPKDPWRYRAQDREQYERLFRDAGDARAVGEASASYLFFARSAERMQQVIPDGRLICILRDPIERAYSHFGLNLKVGFETLSDFESAVSAESDPRRQQYGIRFAYSGASLYHDRLRGFWTRFPRERILVLLFQDFAADPAGTMRRVYDFLAVDPRFTPDVAVRHNRSMTPRGSLVREAFGRQRRLRRFLQRNLPPRLVTRIGDVIMRPPPGLTPEVRERLLPRFDAEIQRLEALLDRDLSAWRSAQA